MSPVRTILARYHVIQNVVLTRLILFKSLLVIKTTGWIIIPLQGILISVLINMSRSRIVTQPCCPGLDMFSTFSAKQL